MLTSVSIRWTVGRLLPTVSYLTSLDKYSLMSMLIITTELIYHGIMGYIFRKIPEDIAYKIDAGAFLPLNFNIYETYTESEFLGLVCINSTLPYKFHANLSS